MYKKPYDKRKKTYKKKESFRLDRPMPVLARALFESKLRLNKIKEVKKVSVLQYDNQDRSIVVLAVVNTEYNLPLHNKLSLADYQLHKEFKKRGIDLNIAFGW